MDLMEDMSERLAVQLQLNRPEKLHVSKNGKHWEDDTPDDDYAVAIYTEELPQLKASYHTRRGLEKAAHLDTGVINFARADKEHAIEDRRVGYSQGGGVSPQVEPRIEKLSPSKLSSSHSRKAKGQHSSQDLVVEAESSSWAALRNGSESSSHGLKRIKCIICQEEKLYFDTLEAPCYHHHCRGCIIALFEASAFNESLFPPSCCHEPIPLSSAKDFLSLEAQSLFQAKAVEFGTPDRLYCYQTTCSTFIPPSNITEDIGSCPSCKNQTCLLCKRERHAGDCPVDEHFESLLALASESGWMQCFKCRRIVERTIGCNHIR
ncbi:hypothetical protein MMC19_003064 [Ptychographa xylographoides]|nr:hypothetical protein [Ptychographa xylographoides]